MSVNLSSLKNIESKNSIDTSIGRLYLFWLSMKDTEILSRYFKNDSRDKDELNTIQRLITLTFYPESSLREGKYKPDSKVLTLEDVEKLTNEEIEVIAGFYIDKNPYLYMKDKKIAYLREEKESNVAYLYRLLSTNNDKYLESIEDLKKSMSMLGGFSPNLEKAVLGNIVTSKKLAEAIGFNRYKEQSPHIMPSTRTYAIDNKVMQRIAQRESSTLEKLPEKLDELITYSSETVSVMSEGNVKNIEMQSESKKVLDENNKLLFKLLKETEEGSTNAERKNNIVIFIAAITLFFTIISTIISVIGLFKEQSKQIDSSVESQSINN